RREEVAEREDKGESGAREQSRHREGKDDAEKRGARVSAEVLRSFDERARDVFERVVDGEEDEGCVNVREHENDGKRTVEEVADRFVSDAEILEKTVEGAVAAENG